MADREPVRWITIKGKHLPVFSDGTIGVGQEDEPNKFTREQYYENINTLKDAKNSSFPDSKISPLKYDKSMLMDIAFGNWKNNKDNFIDVKNVDISNIISVQPNVQAGKLKEMFDVDTESVKVLQVGNKYYLGDGNHRIVSAYLQGKKTVKVQVYKE